MIDQLRQGLEQADTWPKYRAQLKEFRELYGPPFAQMEPFARETLGIKNPPGKTTFVRLTGAEDKPPEWPQVSAFVRVCVRHAQEKQEGMQDVGTHLTEILVLWREAFVRLGGKVPVPPTAATPPSAAAPAAAEPPTTLSGTAQPPPPVSRWAASREWIRRQPKKVTVPAAVLLVLALGTGAYVLVDTGQGKSKTVGTAGDSPAPTRSTAIRTGSPSPTASTPPSTSPSGSGAAAGTASAGGAQGGTDSSGTTGSTVGSGRSAGGTSTSGSTTEGTGTVSSGASGPGNTRSSGGTSGSTNGSTGSSGSSQTSTPEAQPYIDAAIAWSNDEDGSTDPKDPDAIVKVYDTYKEGAGTSVHAYYRTDSIRVKCQVTGGRLIKLGDLYDGPKPHRDRIWYLMDTGEWAPAVYVDTRKDSLPTCSAADS
ncbi:hypothetical protein [Streptomyces humi]